MILTRKALINVALSTLNLDKHTSESRTKSIFSTHFGCSIDTAYHLWNTLFLDDLVPEKGLTKHLFWSLVFLKTYSTETVLACRFNTTENTFRKWVTKFVESISKIEVVSKWFRYEKTCIFGKIVFKLIFLVFFEYFYKFSKCSFYI
jgi:hypothetical protein